MVVSFLAAPAITWFFQGASITTNTTLSFNVGDTFNAQCKGSGNAIARSDRFLEAYITKSAPVLASTISFTPATSGVMRKLFISSGSFVWNNYEGLFAGFDHWSVSMVYFDKPMTGTMTSLLLQISVPRVSAVDAGSYFCSFFDATGANYEAGIGFSAALTLSVVAKSAARNLARSKTLDYTIALISAVKTFY